MEKTPLILQIQSDCLDESISVANTLRKAKVAATKLELAGFLEWIDKELNGYDKEVPEYRKITGEPKAWNPYHGWQPILTTDQEFAESISRAPIGQAIGPMEGDIKKPRSSGSILFFPYPPATKAKLVEMLEVPTDIHIRLSEGSIIGIIDTVRNTVLNWTLELEQNGVLGENMSFEKQDKQKATQITQHIYATNIGMAGSAQDNASISSMQINSQTNIDLGKITELLDQAKSVLPNLPAELREEAKQCHADLVVEVGREQPDQSRLRSMLASFKSVCEGATGNLTAQGIISVIESLLG